jgi:shikimate kinase
MSLFSSILIAIARVSLVKFLITGFSGSGKSFTLKKIENEFQGHNFINKASLADLHCVDLDWQVLKALKINHLANWVERYGWEEFRNKEQELLYHYLNSDNFLILALGAGSLTAQALGFILSQEKTQLLWLDISLENCLQNLLVHPTEQRPMLTKLGLLEIENLYQQRCDQFYSKGVRFQSPEALIDYIKSELATFLVKD